MNNRDIGRCYLDHANVKLILSIHTLQSEIMRVFRRSAGDVKEGDAAMAGCEQPRYEDCFHWWETLQRGRSA